MEDDRGRGNDESYNTTDYPSCNIGRVWTTIPWLPEESVLEEDVGVAAGSSLEETLEEMLEGTLEGPMSEPGPDSGESIKQVE
jgi:hypothetical protein